MSYGRMALTIFCCAMFWGCANKAPEITRTPTISTIAIVSVAEPKKMSVVNRNPLAFVSPLAGVITDKVNNMGKPEAFTETMLRQNMKMAVLLIDSIAEELRSNGYTVSIVDAVPVPEDDPDEIDFRQVKTDADAILYVYFTDVGLASYFTSSSYLPRININGALRVKDEHDDFYNEDLCYGEHHRVRRTCAVAADPKFSYSSFDAAITRAAEIREAFETGTQALGKRMAIEIKAALK